MQQSQNPVFGRTIPTGQVQTVPTEAVLLAGTATYKGGKLSIKDYDFDELVQVKQYDGFLVGGELAIVSSPPRQIVGEAVQIALIPLKSFTSDFTDQPIYWAKGIQQLDYPKQWYINGYSYTLNGNPQIGGLNFTKEVGLQLISTGDTVYVGTGTITATFAEGVTPITPPTLGSLQTVIVNENDSYTLPAYGIVSIQIVGNEATFNGEDISGILAQSGAFTFEDNNASSSSISITTGFSTTAVISYRL